MSGDISNYKRLLRKAFGCSVSSAEQVNPFSVQIEFSRLTDIMSVLEPHQSCFSSTEQSELKAKRDMLYRITQNSGLIILKNTIVEETEEASLVDGITTARSGTAYKLIQDPPHRDAFCRDELNPKITVLHKSSDSERSAPTLYATANSVKNAMLEILKSDLTPNIKHALEMMTQADYTFTLGRGDVPPRRCIQLEYENLTNDIFKIIPESEQYSHVWAKGDNTVLLHSNSWSQNSLLHCRPASNDKSVIMAKRVPSP
ncbi:MAG: hypothetical protein JKY11_02140 [Alphaproteobacteria bacterium]|nr:hypothetical protein [Alphaproteobacteria bacterium]